MAYLDSTDLVRRGKVRLARPSTDSAFTVTTTDDAWYDFATEAQDRLNKDLAIHCPDAQWTVPTELSSSDGNYTYTFGTDVDGEAIIAMGHFSLYENKESIPDYPLTVNVDYTIEGSGTDGGTVIRIPYNTTRTFTDGGPYAQYVAPSNVVTSTTQPTVPKVARPAMLDDMERRAWLRLGLDDKAADAEAKYQDSFMQIKALFVTQAHGKGGRTLTQRPNSFWRMRRWV